MPGVRIASTDGAGWSVETVELVLTSRTGRRGGRPMPVGDGAQLLVCRNGYLIAYCARPADLAGLGVDLSRMAVVDRWLVTATAAVRSGGSARAQAAVAELAGARKRGSSQQASRRRWVRRSS